jgi:tripartite ATP-independent transporter DctP family solute receptor
MPRSIGVHRAPRLHFPAVACLLLVVLALAAPPLHAQVLRLGYALPPDSQYGDAASAMADELGRGSSQRLKLQQFPNGQLGDATKMAGAVRRGELDLLIATSGIFAAQVPDLQILDLPYLFDDSAHVAAVLDGPLGKRLMAAVNATGVIGLAWGDTGFREITNAKRPLRRPEDLQGLRLRVMDNPVLAEGLTRLGATTTRVPFLELFGALRQGALDGQENPLGVILSVELWRVQRYLSLTDHAVSPALIVVSPARWGTLVAAERTLLTAAAQAGAAAMRARSAADREAGIALARQRGMVVETDPDRAAFRAALRAATADFARRFDQAELDAISRYPR